MVRAVRRRRTAAVLRPALLAAWAAVLALALSGCGGIGQPAPYDTTGIDALQVPTPSPDAADFTAVIDNPWLALSPGSTHVYDVSRAGLHLGSLDVEVADEPVTVDGVGTSAVTQELRLDDGTTGGWTDYYAQDHDGNVWWFGRDGDDATPWGSGSWRAGGGAGVGLLLPAQPRLGDGWVGADLPGDDEVVIRALGRTEAAGWSDAVEVEWDHGTTQRRYYVKGVGLVRILDVATRMVFELTGSTSP